MGMSQQKTGILLVNLGTPEAPTPTAVARYLRQFLSDRRVVDVPRLLWWPLLRAVILPLRAPRVAKLYQSVWMEGGSPLRVYSQRQVDALQARLGDIPVALGMSYGKPSMADAVTQLLDQDVDNLVVLPLYPQYSCSTVAAVWDELGRILAPDAAGLKLAHDGQSVTVITPRAPLGAALIGKQVDDEVQIKVGGAAQGFIVCEVD